MQHSRAIRKVLQLSYFLLFFLSKEGKQLSFFFSFQKKRERKKIELTLLSCFSTSFRLNLRPFLSFFNMRHHKFTNNYKYIFTLQQNENIQLNILLRFSMFLLLLLNNMAAVQGSPAADGTIFNRRAEVGQQNSYR